MDLVSVNATRHFVASLYWSIFGNESLSLLHAKMGVSWASVLNPNLDPES